MTPVLLAWNVRLPVKLGVAENVMAPVALLLITLRFPAPLIAGELRVSVPLPLCVTASPPGLRKTAPLTVSGEEAVLLIAVTLLPITPLMVTRPEPAPLLVTVPPAGL